MYLLAEWNSRHWQVHHCSYGLSRFRQSETPWSKFLLFQRPGYLGHAGKLFTTIAVQLANTLPAFQPYVCEAIAKRSNIAQHDFYGP
jgi:hypothetical protein